MISILHIMVFAGILSGITLSPGIAFASNDTAQITQTPPATINRDSLAIGEGSDNTAQITQTPPATINRDSLAITDGEISVDISELPPLTESVRLTDNGGLIEATSCYDEDPPNSGNYKKVVCPDIIVITTDD